jgi:serine/threonine protein kinase
VILEYISGGSIRGLIDKYGSIDEKIVSQYTRQILKGLAFLHFHGISHRDLKCNNILIDSLGRIKLTDFSCSRLPDQVTGDMSDKKYYVKSSSFWMAPEVNRKFFFSHRFFKAKDIANLLMCGV